MPLLGWWRGGGPHPDDVSTGAGTPVSEAWPPWPTLRTQHFRASVSHLCPGLHQQAVRVNELTQVGPQRGVWPLGSSLLLLFLF